MSAKISVWINCRTCGFKLFIVDLQDKRSHEKYVKCPSCGREHVNNFVAYKEQVGK